MSLWQTVSHGLEGINRLFNRHSRKWDYPCTWNSRTTKYSCNLSNVGELDPACPAYSVLCFTPRVAGRRAQRGRRVSSHRRLWGQAAHGSQRPGDRVAPTVTSCFSDQHENGLKGWGSKRHPGGTGRAGATPRAAISAARAANGTRGTAATRNPGQQRPTGQVEIQEQTATHQHQHRHP